MIDRGFGDVIEDKSQRREKAPTPGRVTKVYEKTDNDLETGNIEVNVLTNDDGHEFRRVPVLATDHHGHISVPEVGEHVLVDFTLGRGRQPIVVGAGFTDEDRAPHARAGHWRHEWGEEGEKQLYLEAEPSDGSAGEPDVVRFGIKQDGTSEPTTEVAVDNTDSDTTIRLDTDGDVTINAAGEVLIESSDGNATSLAPADHTHEYDWADTGGAGTTDPPSEAGTDSTIN